MASPDERNIARYRNGYSRLLRLYPGQFRARFGEAMRQSFVDLCRERLRCGRGLFGLALWLFAETSAGILRETTMSIVTHNKRLIIILLAITCVLLLPAVAMRFTDEVSWTSFDFVVAGGLLLAAGLTFEFFARRRGSTKSRVIAGVAIAAALLVVWLELAVGIFGSPLAGS
jgi:hypothetical protein